MTRVLQILAVLAILLGAGSLALGAALVVLAPIHASDATLRELGAQLSDLRSRRLATEAALHRANGPGQADEQYYFVSSSPTTSAALLQEHVHALIDEVSGVLLTSQASTDPATEGIARIRILVRARLAEPAAVEVLQRLQSGHPSMLIGALDLRPVPVADGGPPLEFTGLITAFHADAD